MRRRLIHLALLFPVSAALFGFGALHGGIPRGLFDHSLCCGLKPNSIHGEGMVDPSDDFMFRRHRVALPAIVGEPAPASPAIPGSDTFVRETPPTAEPPATQSAFGSSAHPADASRKPDERKRQPELVVAEAGAVTADPAEPPVAPLQMPTERVDGYLRVGFDVLGGFPFKLTKAEATATVSDPVEAAAKALAQIPDVIRQLDGQKVLATGFMLPMKMEGSLTTEFLLVANSMLCCYGVVPPMNQWMVVTMASGGVPAQQDVPLQFQGTLRVQPRYDNGALSAIYQLEGERMRKP